jgi:hypothetical protein
MTSALKYFSVYFLSGLKFIFGPSLGVAYDLPVPVTILLTTLGMMTTVYLFTFFGDKIRSYTARFRRSKRVFSKKSRRFVKIWVRFGLKGVCFLTPLLLTPPGGAFLINLLGSNKRMIIKWMWISAISWSTILTLILNYASWLIEGFI